MISSKAMFLFKTAFNCGMLFLLFSLCSFTPGRDTIPTTSTFKFKSITIDAGHGGKDPGARGSYSVEKNVTLAIAKRLKAAIDSQITNVQTIMTRTDDTFIPLNQRSAIANQNHSNLFISIHCNSSPEGNAAIAHKRKGVLLLVYGFHRLKEQEEAVRENSSIFIEKDYKQNYESYDESDPSNLIILNAYIQKYRKQSILFGDLLNTEFEDTNGRESAGVKEQGVLVLAHSAMPAVLIETGFINNPEEEDYLNSPDGQNEIVQSIIRAINSYRKAIGAL
ncbi:N-acetylmuramoyl-L-alanine amidase family protein [Mucilaginibacter aquaedulcis]|uniref:N-acetylmuramoyl-L-alanine amidase family protein n=1 Tax=Mucilaginibacter aquaedulcis TaxID=1187081 RepID=UPI0025B57E35|nr:N-acetylmuramoyl-L-alanine amidase [Mucilaginibacter aquaedulcis]MDN3549246.1 N-acetylmuramoyl-L-alanine amidase [Mucilaginibacter aquaedulcis]